MGVEECILTLRRRNINRIVDGLVRSLRKLLPKVLKSRAIQAYHCLLLYGICRNWIPAILDRLNLNKQNTRLLIKLRWNAMLELEAGTFDTQVLAEVCGERVYTPPNVLRRTGAHPGVILDVGANKGIILVFAAKIFPKSRIISFEPDH